MQSKTESQSYILYLDEDIHNDEADSGSEADDISGWEEQDKDDATCKNYMGSYACMCNYGFTGDGTTCTAGIICTVIYDKAKFYCQSGFTENPEIQCEIMFCLFYT